MAIFAIVGMLGTLHPAIHFAKHHCKEKDKDADETGGIPILLPRLVLALVSYAAAAPALAEEVKAGDLVISQAWSRATPGGAKIGGGYLTIENKGSTPDRLLGGSADVADRVQIHEMAMNNGVMTMRPLEKGAGDRTRQDDETGAGRLSSDAARSQEPAQAGRQAAGDLEFEKAGKVKVLAGRQGMGAQRPAAEGGGMPMKKMPEHSGMKM